jgi:hypothetical protein
MALSSRFVLRRLRVVIACVMLGVLAPLPSASACVDSVVLVASAIDSAAKERPKPKHAGELSREATRFNRAALAPSPRNKCETRGCRIRPPGARAVVVQHRLYMRHAALLC